MQSNINSDIQLGSNRVVDIKSFILLWAFAETSIGGVLHALKLPFTGILVGGVAVISIALIGFYQKEGSNKIIEALLIIIMVKLLVSPHSPWQAYIAVAFQGYLGSLIYRKKNFFKVRTTIFAILALFESAIQKLLVALLIFGNNFFESIDIAAASVVSSLGWNTNLSIVYLVFGIYIVLHLIVGAILGYWIPKIPNDVKQFMDNMPFIEDITPVENSNRIARIKRRLWVSIGIFIAILVILKLLLPDTGYAPLIWMFLRALLVSLALVFIVGPFLKKVVEKYIRRQNIDTTAWNDIINMIPQYTLKAYGMMKYVNTNYKGFSKVKYLLLGFIALSFKEIQQ